MGTDAREGFRLGPWRIEPSRGAIVGPGENARHVEPKVMEVLVRLADKAGELVPRDELLESVWTRHVAADQLLTRAISELRRALDDHRGQPKYIETVPKRGYRLIGPLDALGAATPAESPAHFPRRNDWRAYGLAAVLVIVLGSALAYLMFNRDTADGSAIETATDRQSSRVGLFVEPTMSIAVLPFANISDDPANEYLSDGLTEEIRNLLAKSGALKVIGRTSSFAFKGRHADLRVIGDALGVNTILEGSVRKSGDRLRITAQLIDASDGSHIWSASYDRRMKDVFEIQDEVARHIFDSLRVYVVSYPTRGEPTTVAEAYAGFLKARSALNVQDAQTAEQLLLEAVERDPEFAEAWELLAHVYWTDTIPGVSPAETQERFRDAATKALSIDPDLDLARALLYEGDPGTYTWADVIDAGVAALRGLPNDPLTLRTLSWNLIITGYLEEGRQVAARLAAIDPLSSIAHVRHAAALLGVGHKDAAAAEFEVARELNPGGTVDWYFGVVLLRVRQDDRAIAHMETAVRDLLEIDTGWVREIITDARRSENDPAYLDRAIPRVLELMGPEQAEVWQHYLNGLYLYFDFIDRYYDILLAHRPDYVEWSQAMYYVWEGTLAHDRGFFAHPKYIEVAERMGFIEVWERRGPPDFCEKPSGQWVCR